MSGLVLEGFAGPGGWSTGLAMLGHTRSVGIELDPDACATAVAAGHKRIRADVATYPLAHLAGTVDGVILSPPCPLFSRAGQRLGIAIMDILIDAVAPMLAGQDVRPQVHADVYPHALTAQHARNQRRSASKRWPAAKVEAAARRDTIQAALVLEPARYAHGIGGLRWLACEQVPDVLPLWAEYARCLRRSGWSATAGLLSSEQFGVPQTRSRAFLAARNDGQPARLPAPSHARYVPGRRLDEPAADGLFAAPDPTRIVLPADRGLLPWVSMADALGMADGHLRTQQRSETAAGRVWICRDSDQPAPTLVANSDRWTLQTNQVPAGMDGSYQQRDPHLPAPTVSGQGNSWSWTLANAQDKATRRDMTEPAGAVFCSRSGNLRWALRNGNQDHSAVRDQDQPAPTVHFGGRCNAVDWVTDRAATVRVQVWQAGVLQGFPPDYPWRGTRTAQYRRVGDAVPPPLAAAVAGELLDVDWRARLWSEAGAA